MTEKYTLTLPTLTCRVRSIIFVLVRDLRILPFTFTPYVFNKIISFYHLSGNETFLTKLNNYLSQLIDCSILFSKGKNANLIL